MPPDPRVPRSSSWAMVDNLDALGNFNWPKVIFDNLHASFAKLKHLKDDPDKEQHYFSGFAPIFEAVVFSRIQSLAPKPNPELACLHPPIQSYSSKRTGWRPLNTIEASEITPCSYCGDGVEGDGSPSPSSSIPVNVAENFLASGAESDSASSLKEVHDCLAKDSLASSFEDICIDDASSQPSVPVNDAQPLVPDAQPSVPPPLPRRSSRARREVVKYSPSFLKK